MALSGPLGEFCLSRTSRPMIWVASGSGIAPLWSMARHMLDQSIRRPTQFFYFAPRPEGLVLREQMAAMQRQLPAFEYVPVLSHLAAELDARLADLRGHEAYICGPPHTVEIATKVMLAKGVSERRLFYDRFA